MVECDFTLLQNDLSREFRSKYTLGKVLGDGTFAHVREAAIRTTGKKVAVKCIRKSCKLREVSTEVAFLKSLSHPNIVKVYDFFVEKNGYYVVMELLEGGDLYERLHANGVFSEDATRLIVHKILLALRHCHQNNIVHRDLKPENILLTSTICDTQIKLADFGFATKVRHKALEEFCGTAGYVAPEIIKSLPYSTPVDIWSVGIIMYVLLTGNLPFGVDRNTFKEMCPLSPPPLWYQPYHWAHISDEAKHFLERMLVVEPACRATADELLKDPWLEKAVPTPQPDIPTKSNRRILFTKSPNVWTKFIKPTWRRLAGNSGLMPGPIVRPHSVIYASQSTTPAQMTIEREIVQMIIERETCLEALDQAANHFRDPHSKVRPWKVIQNLSTQYRRATVEVVEGITKWRTLLAAPRQVFVWKQTNYLHKMLTDTNFFESVSEMFRDCTFPLNNNPFLSPLTLKSDLFALDDVALVRKARLICNEIGNIDMERICMTSKVLLAEGIISPPAPKKSIENKDVDIIQVPNTTPSTEENLPPQDKVSLMKLHLDHAKSKLQELEEERTDITQQMQQISLKIEATTLPSKLRSLQNKLGTHNNNLKSLSGEIFQRRNEFTKQEAAYRLQLSKHKKTKPQISSELHHVIVQDQKARDELVASIWSEVAATKPMLESMNEDQVFDFVKELGLDSCAEKLRKMGIDGALLAVSTDQDLQELGIDVRLHRVKILREVEKFMKQLT
ncbi:calcium/calmodulin-dependent protein kinase [Thraustotheca clavata]|uniref:Calcium/calmodulin-dependent protein kinase n=1 Tax=Thraustotheca clavata TaxID=74557 RepID=A0A1V9Y903_9STRA|nr:calcium/calmodulin-dependent protein kinase [Thraustotheca clavata]